MIVNTTIQPGSLKQQFIPSGIQINSWKDIQNYYEELSKRNINSIAELEKWLLHLSELEATVNESLAWRYIKMTCNTQDPQLLKDYTTFITEIEPQVALYTNELNKKMISCPYTSDLEESKYFVHLRAIKKDIFIYREKNIKLLSEITKESQKYNAIIAAQTIVHQGEEITLQAAAVLMKNKERLLREAVYRKIQNRKDSDEENLNQLYTRLIHLRHEVALNAGFTNYRDYKFQELGRFDYSINDCFHFHSSIEEHIVPLVKKLDLNRKQKLKLEVYRPWDLEVDMDGKEALKPFNTGEELLDKSIDCFYKIDPYFGECLEIMRKMGNLDLVSRKGKAPGGYNYPLDVTGIPFIFMNAVGTLRDLVTMVHEGGHALHSFLSKEIPLTCQKRTPSEVAELASMGMELISMEHWEMFFPNAADLRRAKKEQLEKILKGLPWIASIDKFQHFVYEQPLHSQEERYQVWLEITKNFGTGVVDYTGLEKYLKRSWQAQLHLFEAPFYYIEYGMAQLGAVALWRNYKLNPQKTLEQYKQALGLGYMKPIGEIYATAGIQFNFSNHYIKELADFISEELDKLL